MNDFDDNAQTINMMGRVMTYEAALASATAGRDPFTGNPITESQRERWIKRLTNNG